MNTSRSLLSLILVAPLLSCAAQASENSAPTVKACRDLSLARVGYGVAYRGKVNNSDYGLRLVIPPNLVGWGAADVAPFHGFTIFLPSVGPIESCIVFDLNLRVPLGDAEANTNQQSRRKAQVGNIEGSREELSGSIDGIRVRNTLVDFSFARGSNIYDGEVWLVTPADTFRANDLVLKAFLTGMSFEGKSVPAGH
jgi:hypothetical protein